MPFTEHLRELRNRLLISIATVGGIAVLLFWPSQFVIQLDDARVFHGIELHAFGPADVIFTEFKFSIFGGIVSACRCCSSRSGCSSCRRSIRGRGAWSTRSSCRRCCWPLPASRSRTSS